MQKVCNVRGLFCYPTTGGCALQIKVARDQENILHFELCVKKSIIITLFCCEQFF